VFEHFTHDALPIAREIIAMELKLEQSPINGKPVNAVTNHIPEVKTTDANNFPDSAISIIGLDDPSQPVNKTVAYGTVNGIPGEPSKCWIISWNSSL
jgi:hypothetical protein